jgi:hypothetical protein
VVRDGRGGDAVQRAGELVGEDKRRRMGQCRRQPEPVLLSGGQVRGRLEHTEDITKAGAGEGFGAGEDRLVNAVDGRAVVGQGDIAQPQAVAGFDLFVQGVEQDGFARAAGAGDVNDVAGP